MSLTVFLGFRYSGGTYMCTLCKIPNGSRIGWTSFCWLRPKQKYWHARTKLRILPMEGSSVIVGLVTVAALNMVNCGWSTGDGVTTAAGTSSGHWCSLSSDIGCSVEHGPTPSNSESGLFAVRLSGVWFRRSDIFSIRNCKPASPIASSLLHCNVPATTALCNCSDNNNAL